MTLNQTIVKAEDFDKLIASLISTFGITKPSQRQGAPVAKECDLVAVVRALGVVFDKVLKEKDGVIEKLVEDVNDLKTRVKVLEEEKAANSQPIKLFSSLLQGNDKAPSVVEANIISAVNRESKERKSREKNVVIFGLEESKAEDEMTKTNEDELHLNGLLEAMSIDSRTVNKFNRLKSKNVDKPGAVLVEFKMIETKLQALKAAKNLKSIEKYKETYVSTDMTLAERITHKNLVKVRDERNKKLRNTNGEIVGDKYWGIRDNVLKELKIK